MVEMLLVLTILGVMAAISWPNLHRFMVDQKLKEATEMVRTQLAGTRNKAIDAVLIYEFRYETDGNRFLVIPHESYQIPTAVVDAQGQLSSGDQMYRAAGILRNGVVFAPAVDMSSLGIPVIEVSVPVDDWQLEGLPGADELSGLKWSNPILFYPDGSAAESVLRLQDEVGQLMEISIRGLTAAVSATPVTEETQL
jgi:hypothetical protein